MSRNLSSSNHFQCNKLLRTRKIKISCFILDSLPPRRPRSCPPSRRQSRRSGGRRSCRRSNACSSRKTWCAACVCHVSRGSPAKDLDATPRFFTLTPKNLDHQPPGSTSSSLYLPFFEALMNDQFRITSFV